MAKVRPGCAPTPSPQAGTPTRFMTRTGMNTVCSKGCWRAKGIVPVVPLYVPAETMHVPRSSKLDPDLYSRACCIRRVPAVVPTVGTDSRPCPIPSPPWTARPSLPRPTTLERADTIVAGLVSLVKHDERERISCRPAGGAWLLPPPFRGHRSSSTSALTLSIPVSSLAACVWLLAGRVGALCPHPCAFLEEHFAVHRLIRSSARPAPARVYSETALVVLYPAAHATPPTAGTPTPPPARCCVRAQRTSG